jgi:hypothetical protein
LAVRENDRWADPVEQRGVAGVVVEGLQRCVVLRGDLRSVEGVEDGVVK